MGVKFVENADLDKIYTTRDYLLGDRFIDEQGREYIFIKFNTDPSSTGTTAAVAGLLAVGLTSAWPSYEGTCDFADAAAILNLPLGFVQAALTDGTYGWAQYRGKNRKAMLTSGNVASTEVLFALAGSVGGVEGVANLTTATQTFVGVALAANASTVQAIGTAFINIPI